MYTAIVLTDEARRKLLRSCVGMVPGGWDIVAHHLTLNMGGIEDGLADPRFLGSKADIIVVAWSINDKVAAFQCQTLFKSVNAVPHITVAVNSNVGGKPVMANDLKEWTFLEAPFAVQGTIKEVRG